MSNIAAKSVRDLALENPGATRVFEKFGIDYCCGGKTSIEEACKVSNLSLDEVLASLESAATSAGSTRERDWPAGSLGDLISHLKNTHHKYTRDEIIRLQPLFEKVCSVHGPKHGELLEAREKFRLLAQELTTHMMKEEMVLFPYIERMEEARIEGGPILPAPFGTVQNPVAMMIHEHDSAGYLLRGLRTLTNNYTAPADACLSYRTLYSALEGFERDLHQHIHLENNILFPRAIELERGPNATASND
jgi:regulator of cell morphogenesis and NO signaling